jgi:Flp pilus assembly protein TadG
MRLLRRLRDAKGQTLIETAIVLPLLLLITFAIIDFGVLFTVNLALESGVSQAARYGMTGQAQGGMTREASILAELRRVTPALTIGDANVQFTHLVGGAWVGGVGGPGEIQRISATYTHTVMVLTPFFTNGQITLRAESTMKNEDRFE